MDRFSACFHVTRSEVKWKCWVWSSVLCLTAAHRSCPIGSDCSLTAKDSWEAPKDGRVPPGICYSAICSPPPLNCSHANCCTALTFNLRIHIHSHKPTADAYGRKSPPSPVFFFALFSAKCSRPVICRFQLADCGDMQGFDGGKYSHTHSLWFVGLHISYQKHAISYNILKWLPYFP